MPPRKRAAQDRHAMTDTTTAPANRTRWVALIVLLVAQFMNLIDVTIVNVALPSMQEAFGASNSQIQWVVAGYILCFALLLLPAGRLGDILGRRQMFVAGVAVFTVGSALCGMAPSIELLIAARLFQAVGAAMMTPQTLAFVPTLFSPQERGAAFALTGLTSGLAAVTGPILGGWLVESNFIDLGWRPIFLVNIPVGLIAIAAGLRYLPRLAPAPGKGLDLIGTLLAGITLFCIIFPLIEGREMGWPAWCFAMMAASLPVAGLFALWLRRQAAGGGAQIIPVSLFGNRAFALGTLLSAMLFSAIPGFFLVLALFLQIGHGLTPLQSGLTTVAFSVGVLIASAASGRLGPRWPRQRIAAGALMMAAAMIWLRLVVQGTGEEVVILAFSPPLLLAGIGLGASISPLFQTILAGVPMADTGAASGGLQAFQQMGGAVGVAIMGEMFFATLGPALASATPPHQAYGSALSYAVVYGVFSFGIIAALVWLMPRLSATAQPSPIPVET